MIYLLYTIHIVISLFLIAIVLLQQGKGADLSVFGGGATQTAFGARGATTLLHKLTVSAFIGFIVTTLLIGIVQARSHSASALSALPDEAAPALPSEDAPAGTAPAAPAKTDGVPSAGAPAGAPVGAPIDPAPGQAPATSPAEAPATSPVAAPTAEAPATPPPAGGAGSGGN